MEVDYFSTKLIVDDAVAKELQAITAPYIDKHPEELSTAELLHNSQMLYKLTTEREATDKDREDFATLKQRILDLEAEVVKYQRLYFGISRPQ